MSLEETIPQILSEIQAENYTETLSLTTKLLTKEGTTDDNDVQNEPLSESLKKALQQVHCRTLISLKKYTQVLEYYTSSHTTGTGTNDPKDLLFLEYAYSLYKLGRYAQCRDLTQKQLAKIQAEQKKQLILEGNVDGSISSSVEGMMHILAQCHYRLHETNDASQAYENLLQKMDDTNNDEILTNALAVKVSNTTNIGKKASLPSSASSDNLDEQVMKKLKQIEIGDDNGDETDEFLYELVYNAATELLLQSTSLFQTKKAMELLKISEEKCMQEFDVEEEDGDDNKDDKKINSKHKAKCKNLMPIQANIALAKMQLGDLNGSTRSYLELVLAMKKVNESDPAFDGGGALLAIDNNLVVLNSKRGSSSSVFDLLKRSPDLTTMDGGINGTSGSSSGGGLHTVTPYQVRTILYNRAVLFHKMNKYAECKAVLASLKKSLSTTVNEAKQSNGSKKKRKKGKNSSDTSTGLGCQSISAPAANNVDEVLWESRIALLENECISTKDTSNSPIDNITAIEDKIKSELQKASTPSEIYMFEYALAEVLLYKSQKALGVKSGDDTVLSEDMQRNLIPALEQLPESLRQRPAVVATLHSLYSNMGMEDKVKQTLESTKSEGMTHDSLAEKKRLGDFKLRLGLYEEAATIYKSILTELDNGNESLDEDERMECIAGLIKAMSYFDIDGAIEYSDQLSFENDALDGEELEAMDIPRLSKGASGGRKMRKMIGSNRDSEQK